MIQAKTRSKKLVGLLLSILFLCMQPIAASESPKQLKRVSTQQGGKFKFSQEQFNHFHTERLVTKERLRQHPKKELYKELHTLVFVLSESNKENRQLADNALLYHAVNVENMFTALLSKRNIDKYVRLRRIKFLLRNGVSINEPGDEGRPPLMRALKTHLGLPIIKFLLANGANPNKRDHNGVSPLDRSYQEPKLMALLLQHGADPRLGADKHGQSCLHVAIVSAATHAVKQLCKVALTKTKKEIPLIVLAWFKQNRRSAPWPEVISQLITKYVGNKILDVRDKEGFTPIKTALHIGEHEEGDEAEESEDTRAIINILEQYENM
ncbi:MAG: ankyrin repeat domain-containing protein [Cytophagales bacterium]